VVLKVVITPPHWNNPNPVFNNPPPFSSPFPIAHYPYGGGGDYDVGRENDNAGGCVCRRGGGGGHLNLETFSSLRDVGEGGLDGTVEQRLSLAPVRHDDVVCCRVVPTHIHT
jgi:hypothetical protein